MTDEELYPRLTECFRAIFDEYEGEIGPDTSAADIEQWDSLANVQLMVMIEQELGIRFDTEEIASLNNVGELAELVRTKL